ncbi:MAG: 4-hydroxy-tetrahydrodipicolinate synthase [Flavobacteriaceae bacterium]
MQALNGMGVAMITPFTKKGNIDYLAMKNLIEFYVRSKVNYLVILGTTAETATLTAAEKKEVTRQVVAYAKGRLPLVVGMGGNNTQALVEEIKAFDFSGFSAILSVCPYYNCPNQEGLFQHFSQVAQVSPLPVLLYNVPSRTGISIENDTVIRLAQTHSNIIGIKDARGEMLAGEALIKATADDFMVISGDDHKSLELIQKGGKGVISVIGGAVPLLFSEIITLGLSGNGAKAAQLSERLIPLIDLIFEQGNPTGLKALMAHLELCENTLRLPLVQASAALEKRIEQAYSALIN